MNCRPGCGACCIAPSLSSLIPGQAGAKPAGVPCPQLTQDLRCALFGQSERPQCCASLAPSEEMCGSSREQALAYLDWLEQATRPAGAR
jgi:hypothetical protein